MLDGKRMYFFQLRSQLSPIYGIDLGFSDEDDTIKGVSICGLNLQKSYTRNGASIEEVK